MTSVDEYQRPIIRTLTDLVEHVENTLGWLPPDDGRPMWKVRQIEVTKLKRQMKKKPKLYTFDNLLLAVAYCQARKIEVKSPSGLIYHVERALEETQVDASSDDIGDAIAAAILFEQEQQLPDHRLWIGRLTRATGDHRQAVFAEWVAEDRAR